MNMGVQEHKRDYETDSIRLYTESTQYHLPLETDVLCNNSNMWSVTLVHTVQKWLRAYMPETVSVV